MQGPSLLGGLSEGQNPRHSEETGIPYLGAPPPPPQRKSTSGYLSIRTDKAYEEFAPLRAPPNSPVRRPPSLTWAFDSAAASVVHAVQVYNSIILLGAPGIMVWNVLEICNKYWRVPVAAVVSSASDGSLSLQLLGKPRAC